MGNVILQHYFSVKAVKTAHNCSNMARLELRVRAKKRFVIVFFLFLSVGMYKAYNDAEVSVLCM